MNRISVRRSSSAAGLQTNVNDEIGLEPYLSYTLAQHLEDLSGVGYELASQDGSECRFTNGETLFFTEQTEPVDESALDAETLEMVRRADALPAVAA